MPIEGLIHPLSRERLTFEEALDAKGANGRAVIPPWQVGLLRRVTEEDDRHAGLALTVTRCLTCPRQTFIEDALGYHADPHGRAVMDRGTLAHTGAAQEWPEERYIAELPKNRHLCTMGGRLFGAVISGRADVLGYEAVVQGPDGIIVPEPGGVVPADKPQFLTPGKRVIEIIDTKFPRDGSSYYRKMRHGRMPVEQAFQLNALRLLLAQQPWAQEAGYDPDAVLLTVWDHALGSSKFPAVPEALIADHYDEEGLAEIYPFGYKEIGCTDPGGEPVPGAATVGQIVEIHEAAREEVEAAGGLGRLNAQEKEAVAAKIPLVGEKMMGGSKCVSYCSVSDICGRLVREQGVPACIQPPTDDGNG